MKSFSVLVLYAALSTAVLPASADGKHAPPVLPAAGSLAGIKLGMDRDDAHAALTAAGASSPSTNKDNKDKDNKDKDNSKSADPDAAVPEVWTLKNSSYARVVFAADDQDKVLWVTAFAPLGQGVPFAQIGSLARAAAASPTFAVWNVISPRGSYREIARGQGGKASVVSLLPLKSVNPNGAFSPQIMPKSVTPEQTAPKSTPKPSTAEGPK